MLQTCLFNNIIQTLNAGRGGVVYCGGGGAVGGASAVRGGVSAEEEEGISTYR